jgi:hypothetical protein
MLALILSISMGKFSWLTPQISDALMSYVPWQFIHIALAAFAY